MEKLNLEIAGSLLVTPTDSSLQLMAIFHPRLYIPELLFILVCSHWYDSQLFSIFHLLHIHAILSLRSQRQQ